MTFCSLSSHRRSRLDRKGEKKEEKRRGKPLDLAEFIFKECEEEMTEFFQSMQIIFGNRKEFRRRNMNHMSVTKL